MIWGIRRRVLLLIGLILMLISWTLACSGAEGWECGGVLSEFFRDVVSDVAKEAVEGNGELGLVANGSVVSRGVGVMVLAVPLFHMVVPDGGPEVSVTRPVTSCTRDAKADRGGGEHGWHHATKFIMNVHHAHVAEGTRENWSGMIEAI